jgi:hypothetical protein
MNLQEQERERAAEQWLDEAIGHLRDAGPRTGLETRIVAGLRAHTEQRRRRWTFLVAASAATVLVVALVASWPRSKPDVRPNVAHEASPDSTGPGPVVAVDNVQPRNTSRPPVSRRREVAAATLSDRIVMNPGGNPRQATFPAPAPLTDQGKLLQAYLRQTPQHELVLIAARQRSAAQVDDLSIAPIEIQDLTPNSEKDQN